MIKLRIIKVKDYDYKLIDKDGKYYSLNIEFYDLVKKPQVGDYIFISEKVIRENTFYAFGPIIQNRLNRKDDDLIKIVSVKDEIYLERYYG